MKFSCGMVCRKAIRASEDADIVKGLKNAGAILIGMTNVPELNLWIETRNNVYGQTSNPYNTNRIAGGSSGGEVKNETNYLANWSNIASAFFSNYANYAPNDLGEYDGVLRYTNWLWNRYRWLHSFTCLFLWRIWT